MTDEAIWKTYAKGVRPLDAPPPEKPPVKKKKERPEKPSPPPRREQMVSVPEKDSPEPLDVRIERNLSLGRVIVEARLDLHGKTEEEAHALFLAFVEKQRALGRRLVLVVTGKGREEAGPLRKNLPRWCEIPPFCRAVRAVRTAAALHGGAGAYYILLKKKER